MSILLTGVWAEAEKYKPQFEEMGHKCKFLQWEKNALPCEASWPEVIVSGNFFNFHNIEDFKNLKFIQSCSAGLNQYPLDYIKQNNITIKNARGVYSIPIAEFVISNILQIYKHSKTFFENQKQHEWIKNRNLLELTGKNVCIIGCGSIGTEIAKRLQAFGCQIFGIRRQNKSQNYFDKTFTFEHLYEVLEKSDIIVLAAPLTEQTHHIINAEAFKHIQDSSVLVNIARGSLVDQNALEDNIDRLYGVALDVFEDEPLEKDSILWDKENIIISPHNSFVGENNNERLSALIMKNIKGFGESID